MIDPELLKILCCPETHQDVREAEPAVIEKLNAQVAAGTLKNRAGQPVPRSNQVGAMPPTTAPGSRNGSELQGGLRPTEQRRTTQPVGQKLPNPWGMYDMNRNLWEWCQEWY